MVSFRLHSMFFPLVVAFYLLVAPGGAESDVSKLEHSDARAISTTPHQVFTASCSTSLNDCVPLPLQATTMITQHRSLLHNTKPATSLHSLNHSNPTTTMITHHHSILADSKPAASSHTVNPHYSKAHLHYHANTTNTTTYPSLRYLNTIKRDTGSPRTFRIFGYLVAGLFVGSLIGLVIRICFRQWIEVLCGAIRDVFWERVEGWRERRR